jgi:hypothetical protein
MRHHTGDRAIVQEKIRNFLHVPTQVSLHEFVVRL